MRFDSPWRAAALAALLAGAGCGAGYDGAFGSDASAGATADAAPAPQCFSSNDCPVGWTCNEFGMCEAPPVTGDDAGPPPPPEVEREFGPPQSSLRYLYVAMPELDSLAKIDGRTLEVASVAVGDNPKLVAVIPGGDDAIVFDRAHDTVTIVRPTAGHDDKVTLATLPQMNQVVIDPTGHFAVAWFDLTKAVQEAGGLDNVGEIGSFQDVTVIALERGAEKSVELSVGFRPRKVEFDAAGQRAYVINDDGVSVIDLAQAAAGTLHVAATLPITDAADADPDLMETEISADGGFALSRQQGKPELRIVSLVGGAAATIALPGEPTDVDLSPDGARAYAVIREASTLAIIDLPGDVIDPFGVELVQIGAEIVGSAVIDHAHGRALLFTNAFDEEKIIDVDLAAPGHPWVARKLQKGVRAVAISPDGQTALILHDKRPGDPLMTGDVEEFVNRSYGYSLLDMASGFAKLALTPVDPGTFAFAEDGQHAYLALDGGDAEGAVARLQVLDLDTFVVHDIELGSPPEQVGVLPLAGVAFVSQRHPLGRVTFVDLATRATHTLTGFELGSHIVD